MDLSEGKRDEGDIPVGSVEQTFNNVVVHDAGEWAAVVPRDCERDGHVEVNLSDWGSIP
jgi:hypothetical protein